MHIGREILCFRHLTGHKHTFGPSNSLFRGPCVFLASRGEFHNSVRVKWFCRNLAKSHHGVRLFRESVTTRRGSNRRPLVSPRGFSRMYEGGRWGKSKIFRFFSRRGRFRMQHFKGAPAIVSGEDMGLHLRENHSRWGGGKKFVFFRERGVLICNISRGYLR